MEAGEVSWLRANKTIRCSNAARAGRIVHRVPGEPDIAEASLEDVIEILVQRERKGHAGEGVNARVYVGRTETGKEHRFAPS